MTTRHDRREAGRRSAEHLAELAIENQPAEPRRSARTDTTGRDTLTAPGKGKPVGVYERGKSPPEASASGLFGVRQGRL